jgi:ufm1-conjugating enzyme 1
LFFVYLISQLIKYEFDLEFELPVSYPVTPFEIVLPELDGKTVKMYRGGKIWSATAKPSVPARTKETFACSPEAPARAVICTAGLNVASSCRLFVPLSSSPSPSSLSAHFKPLWAKNVPHFGIAHALAMGLGPWLAAEVPHLLDTGMLKDHKKK